MTLSVFLTYSYGFVCFDERLPKNSDPEQKSASKKKPENHRAR